MAPARFRQDIEGLRAVAVLAVLAHHANEALLRGGFAGVDMFFVVSGFVITTQLVREVERTGTVDLPGFYGRRAKRLLPAAGLVLIFTAGASWLLASRVQWTSISGDIVGAALYVVNWVFAARSVDYLAEDVAPSPVQHYWSLAVEEQFYFIWPVLILGLSAAAARLLTRRATAGDLPHGHELQVRRRFLASGLLVLVVLPSFAWSIYYTATNPQQAYFVTTTRLWELGIGALVAVAAPVWAQFRPLWGALIAWLGLAALLAGLLLQDTTTSWPGSAALVPTLGTAAVLVGGFSATSTGPVRLLGIPALVWIGGLSYSIYLWHWPLLQIATWQFGELSVWAGVVVAAASVGPAWLGYKFVESPLRHSPALNRSPRLALSVGANFTLVSVAAGMLLYIVALPGIGSGAAAEERPPAELSVGAGANDTPLFSVITPDPALAPQDVPDLYDLGCHSDIDDATVRVCELGDRESAIHVTLAGDSKAAQWSPAFETIAEQEGWALDVYTKSACPLTTALTVPEDEPYINCQEWGAELLGGLLEDPPDVLVTSGLRSRALPFGATQGETTREAMVDGYVDAWSQLTAQGVTIIALADSPQQPPDSVYECVSDHPEDANAQCSFPYKDGVGSRALREAADEVEGVTYVDTNQLVCPHQTCPALYRNVLTYRQGSHITATYASVLWRPLLDELRTVLERDPTS